MPEKNIFLLIDGHAVIYRSYFAFPKQFTDQTGLVINAVYGFSRIILTAIRNFSPKYMAIAFDHKTPSFRKKEFEGYKANRPEMPEDLKPQIPIIKKIVAALNIPQFCIEGFEADDVIGTISLQIEKLAHLLTIIVSGDQDLFQLVDDNTHVWLPGRGSKNQDTEYDREGVKDKFGVYPKNVIDYKALIGDNSDNIPGIKGIGPKTAARLLEKAHDLDHLYEAVSLGLHQDIIKGSVKDKLIAQKDTAYLSKELATIRTDVPLDFDLQACKVTSYDKEEAIKIFNQYEFKSLLKMLPTDAFEEQVQDALF